MAYTALERMREINEKDFGENTGPEQPGLHDDAQREYDLKSAALRFIPFV